MTGGRSDRAVTVASGVGGFCEQACGGRRRVEAGMHGLGAEVDGGGDVMLEAGADDYKLVG